MKKKVLWMALLLCMVIFSACAEKKEKDTQQVQNLEFPGLTWDMTPDDVLKKFEMVKEDAVLYDENDRTTSFGIQDLEVFGLKAERVLFNFIDYSSFENMPAQGEGKRRLCQILVFYPQDADLKPVKENMDKAYGATVSEYYPFYQGLEDDATIRMEPVKESESLKYWSSSTLVDVLAKDDLEDYKTYWKNCREGLNDDNWDFFKDHAKMVSVIFSDQEGETGKGLEWDAQNLAVYEELNAQIAK